MTKKHFFPHTESTSEHCSEYPFCFSTKPRDIPGKKEDNYEIQHRRRTAPRCDL
ncbi:MAG: hypothetical protein HUJ73_00735 [Eubacterium sp.]|nr:hypothetical protein [Eubacterium sp.]